MNQYMRLKDAVGIGGLGATLLVLIYGLPAKAQPTSAPVGVYQSGYAPTRFTSHIKQYLLDAQGNVVGLLLRNGVQVWIPPNLSSSLISIAQPGDLVTVDGVPGAPNNFGQVIQAYSITNTDTQRTITAQSYSPNYGPPPGPLPGPPGPPPAYGPPPGPLPGPPGPPPAYGPPPGPPPGPPEPPPAYGPPPGPLPPG